MFRIRHRLKFLGFFVLGGIGTLIINGCAGHPHPNTAAHPPVHEPGFYVAEGLASWYGPGFYGHKTASGERFTKRSLTCAHRNLPFGSKIKVTNLDNDKSVIVRVNDRGPFVRSRIVDLSKEAAQAIDLIRTGTAPVRVEIVHTDEL